MKIHKLLIFLTFMFFSVASQVIPPDETLITTVQPQGVIGLNFSEPGNSEQIAYFIINSNDSSGFILKLELANRGNFKNGTSLIPMTSLVLNKSSGVIGTGLSEPNNLDVLAAVSSGGEFSWTPGSTATTVTSNYMVELKASWADPSGKLAGFYFETVKVTISAGGP
ncbi:MAG: hypothetical protein GX639_18450 [Fibrobacter sp.]|nr:hypothetical protein [Fibrobacter sp.]